MSRLAVADFASRVRVKSLSKCWIGSVSGAKALEMVNNGATVVTIRRFLVREIQAATASPACLQERGQEQLMNAPRLYHDKPIRPPLAGR